MTLKEEAEYIYNIITKSIDIDLILPFYERVNKRSELLSYMMPNSAVFNFKLEAAPLFMFLWYWRFSLCKFESIVCTKQEYEWLLGDTLIMPPEPVCVKHETMPWRVAEFITNTLYHNDMILHDFVDINQIVIAIKRQIPYSKAVLESLSQKILDCHFRDLKNTEFGYIYKDANAKITLKQRQRVADFINLMRTEAIVTDATIVENYICSNEEETEYIRNGITGEIFKVKGQVTFSAYALKYFATQTITIGYEALRKPISELESEIAKLEHRGTKRQLIF